MALARGQVPAGPFKLFHTFVDGVVRVCRAGASCGHLAGTPSAKVRNELRGTVRDVVRACAGILIRKYRGPSLDVVPYGLAGTSSTKVRILPLGAGLAGHAPRD